MRTHRIATLLALTALSLSLPVLAQRGGGARGGGMRSGGFSGGGVRGGSFAPRASGARGFAGGPYAHYAPGQSAYGRSPAVARPSFYSRNGSYASSGYRLPYNGGYRRDRYHYGYPGFLNYGYGYGFPTYGYLDFGDDPVWGDEYAPILSAENDPYAQAYGAAVLQPDDPGMGAAQAYPAQPYSEQPYSAPVYPQGGQPAYGYYPMPAAAGTNPAPEELTTLIFKDGRPPLQIRNYALTRTALYLTGAQTYEIPVDQIDLPATVLVNQQAGISFRLP